MKRLRVFMEHPSHLPNPPLPVTIQDGCIQNLVNRASCSKMTPALQAIWAMKAARLHRKSSQMASMNPHVGCLIFLASIDNNWLTNRVGRLPLFVTLSQLKCLDGRHSLACITVLSVQWNFIGGMLMKTYFIKVSSSLWWRPVHQVWLWMGALIKM